MVWARCKFLYHAISDTWITATYETCLPAPSTPVSALIPGAAEFALDANTSFTIEAFINPDPITDVYARAVIASRSSALRAAEANPNETGWALCIGTYSSIPNNLRWALGDAAGNLVAVDANIGLADGVWHHIAGVVDRDVGTALLFVDGVQVGQTPLVTLGAAATSGPIILGNCPNLSAPYSGMLDEVRISRGALRLFQPVLGESDARYQQRLAIFQPWRLPVFAGVRGGVQALTLSDPSQDDVTGLLLSNNPVPANLIQLDVDETDSTRLCASRWLRIIPESLSPGQSIADDGTTPAAEPSTTGLLPLPANSPALLTEPPGINYIFASTASPLMVLATARALERLAARLTTVSPGAVLEIQSAYLPSQPAAGPVAATTNDNLGRALTVVLNNTVSGFDLGALGALAFESGIAYTEYQNLSVPALRLVVKTGADLELGVSGGGGVDVSGRQIVIVNQPVTITIKRPVPQTVNGLAPQLEWSLLPCGPAAGTLQAVSSAAMTMSFTGTAFGTATIELRYTLIDGVTVLIGSLPVIIAPQTLDGCEILGGDGTVDADETQMSGGPDPDFRTDYLITSANPAIDYQPGANLMQLALKNALIQLAQLAALEPGAPRITVLGAYDPSASNLQAVGRGLVVAPSGTSMTAARLGALAFLAGFSYIERRRYPPSVYLSVPEGDRFEVVCGSLKRLWPNARISGRGVFMATEFDAAGPPDAGFNLGMLQPFTTAGVSFAVGVSNQVQSSLATTLTSLLAALAADKVTGTLNVIAGFQPQDPTLLGVGRAVLARHSSVAADRLSGYALQAGFGFVHHRTQDPGGPAVYMASYPSSGPPPNLLSNTGPTTNYFEVSLNTLTELSIRPQLAVQGKLDWSVEAACPAAGVISTTLPEPSDKAGITEKIFRERLLARSRRSRRFP